MAFSCHRARLNFQAHSALYFYIFVAYYFDKGVNGLTEETRPKVTLFF